MGRDHFRKEADMTDRIRWILPLAMMVAFGVGAPEKAEAASCTRGYEMCLNDTWDTRGFARALADVECFAEYVGCVRRKA